MIEEVIKDIKLAEEQASKIKEQAEQDAIKDGQKAEKEVLEIKNKTLLKIKTERDSIISSAQKTAQNDYDNGIKTAIEESQAFVKEHDKKVEELATELFKGVINGDC